MNRLGRRQGAGVPELPETSDSETDAEGKEKDAKVSNSAEEDSFCMHEILQGKFQH